MRGQGRGMREEGKWEGEVRMIVHRSKGWSVAGCKAGAGSRCLSSGRRDQDRKPAFHSTRAAANYQLRVEQVALGKGTADSCRPTAGTAGFD